MKFFQKSVVVGGCLTAVWLTSTLSLSQQQSPSQPIAATELASGMPEQTTDQDTDWFEEHESNGPEGSRGVPMQCLSLPQLGLVAVIMLSGAGLMIKGRQIPNSNAASKSE